MRDARARLIADDLVTARTVARAGDGRRDRPGRAPRPRSRPRSPQAREAEAALEAALREDLPALSRAQETWFGLSGLRERLRGTQSLAAERVRNAAGSADEPAERGGRDPDQLEAEAERVREQEARISAEVDDPARGDGRRVNGPQGRRGRRRRGGPPGRRAAARRRRPPRGPGPPARPGQRAEVPRRRRRRRDRPARARPAAEAQTRAERAQRDFTALETRVAGLDAGEEGLDAEHEAAVSILDDLDERLAKAREEATAGRPRARRRWPPARTPSRSGLNRKDGAGALLAASDSVSGLLGSVAALLSVRTGFEAAIAGALGSAADAVAVTDAEAALGAIEHLKSDDLGRAGILLGGSPAADTRLARPPRRRDVRRGRGGVPGRAAPGADPAAVQDRRRRRPAGGAGAGRRGRPTSPR